MKKHLVSILYQNVHGRNYQFTGLVDEELGDNGKPIVRPATLFKQAFGFELPIGTTMSIG